MYKNPRGHAVNLLKILEDDGRWNVCDPELEMLRDLINRIDDIMEAEEQECDARAVADFHERAYGSEL